MIFNLSLRHFLTFISISILSTSCVSNEQTQKVEKVVVTQNFEVGTKYKYEVQRGQIDSSLPGSEKVKTATDIEFEVINKKDSLKECSWKYGSTKIIGINPDLIDEQTKIFMNVHEGLEVKFLIDRNGIIHEITNFEECKDFIYNTFENVYKIAPNKPSPEQIQKMLDILKPSLATPELLISTYCPELSVFFNLFGQTIISDSVYIDSSELPNPFGGKNFPTKETTKIENITSNIASISVKQEIPDKEFKTILRETFVELYELAGKTFNENDIPEMSMSTNSTYNFDFEKNILMEVNVEKPVEVSGKKKTETLNILYKN